MLVIGLMSGTSMDGIDAAIVDLQHQGEELHLHLVDFTMHPYQSDLRSALDELLPPKTGSTQAVCEMGVRIGQAFAQAVHAVCAKAQLSLDQIDVIASHGQTIYHQVAPDHVRSTLQIGTAAEIAEATGRTVVADFRPGDIAAQGQGAPLVPYLDQLLFRHPTRNRALQNIGGIGNVSYVPRSGEIVAFDTGPGNVLIDEAIKLLSYGRLNYDHNGELAAKGQIHEELLSEWLEHPFFTLEPPRSTGRELFGAYEARQYITQCHARDLSVEDTIATLTAFTAESIADSYKRYCGPIDEIIVSGGGSRNATLVKMIANAMPHCQVSVVDQYDLNSDAKEAVAFAVMGYATLHGWPNNVPGATGASRPVVLGNITPGHNYRQLLQQVLASSAEPIQRIINHA
jgi:anhydro-N-acetylmuramic acid kinase